MDNLTLISCSYNTPTVTENMLKTFVNLHERCDILISENSTDNLTELFLKENGVPFIRNYGGLHAPSVDLLLKNVKTDYVLLVDTDVLFIKNHEDIFEKFKQMDLTVMGDIVGDRGGKRLHKRVNPWHCFINVKKVKLYGINFYDEIRMKSRDAIRYDVGSSFFEDVKNAKLRIGDFNGNGKYYLHFEGMSWRTKKYSPNNIGGDIDTDSFATHDDVGLYQYGLYIESLYRDKTKHLKEMTYGNTNRIRD